MLHKKMQFVAQLVGCITIALLAVYGLLTLLGSAPTLVAAAELLGLKAAEAPVIPDTFNYQGLLRDPKGNLMTDTYTITAKIYTTVIDSLDIYHETFLNVTVRDGLFNVVLGDDPQGQDLSDAFSATPRYIGITLVGRGGELMPRQRIHAVPWAIYATNASQAADFTVSGDATVNGNITATTASIGTATVTTASIGAATVTTATVTTATIGSLRVNGDITASGNISWNRASGHLTGLYVTDDYYVPSIAQGDLSTPMVPSGNSMCFLTHVWFEDLEDDQEWGQCKIVVEDNYWYLHALANGDWPKDAVAVCKARCLQW
jgi:hypothetical protein